MDSSVLTLKVAGGPSYPHFVRIESCDLQSSRILQVDREGVVNFNCNIEGFYKVIVDGVCKGKYTLPGDVVIVITDDHYRSQQLFHEGE